MRERTVSVGLRVGFVGLFLAALTAPANADQSANEIAGMVVETKSRWGYGGDVIVTEATIETADGTRVLVHQLGGQVGDIAMAVSHSPPVLAAGAYARVETRPALALTGRTWHQVTRVVEAGALAPHAMPFVRTVNDNNTALFWESGCTVIGVEESVAATVPRAATLAAIESAIGEWNSALDECSYLDLIYAGTVRVEPGFDGVNVIRFREQRWCRPASGSDPEVCHDPAAAALTFLTFGVTGDRDGEILDADIEMNGVNFGLVANGQGNQNASCLSDIGNTLTHELGHFLGLDHTCWDGRGTRPVDSTGELVPACSPEAQLSAEIRDATMYNFQECGETKKQSLETDDRISMCSIYAAEDNPLECNYPEVSTGGFCSAGTGPRGGSLLVLLALLGLRLRQRGGRVPLKS